MLSKKAKYGINALIVLARLERSEHLSTTELAGKAKVPKKFLEQILLELKSHGIVQSRKGKGGGYYLRKEPQEVNLADIIRVFDGPIAILPCATHKFYTPCEECPREKICALRYYVKELRDITVNYLKQISLENLINKELELENIEKKFSPQIPENLNG